MTPTVPYLVLSPTTIRLIRDIFDIEERALQGYPLMRRAVVDRTGGTVSVVREESLSVPSALLHSIASVRCPRNRPPQELLWEVFAGELPPHGQFACSGTQIAWIFSAHGRSGWEMYSSIFEFVSDGWLFWSPISRQGGFLQLVLPQTYEHAFPFCKEVLKRTQLLRDRVTIDSLITGPVPCAAALHTQPAGTNWVAAGSSALRWDSVSGDGTASSLRSAILACAALRSAADTMQPGSYFQHYCTRLRMAFREHIRTCSALYHSAGLSAAWEATLKGLWEMADSMNHSLQDNNLNYRLEDYRLVRVERQSGD